MKFDTVLEEYVEEPELSAKDLQKALKELNMITGDRHYQIMSRAELNEF